MKHLTILVPNEQTGANTISCTVGAYHIFTGANEYVKANGKRQVDLSRKMGFSRWKTSNRQNQSSHPTYLSD